MTGSGNFPPGRALRPEVRLNKEQEEAVMKKAEVTREHRETAVRVWNTIVAGGTVDTLAQSIADAEARGEARNAERDCHGVAYVTRASESRRLIRRLITRIQSRDRDPGFTMLDEDASAASEYLHRTHDPRLMLRGEQ